MNMKIAPSTTPTIEDTAKAIRERRIAELAAQDGLSIGQLWDYMFAHQTPTPSAPTSTPTPTSTMPVRQRPRREVRVPVSIEALCKTDGRVDLVELAEEKM
jgi:hypothetical protein